MFVCRAWRGRIAGSSGDTTGAMSHTSDPFRVVDPGARFPGALPPATVSIPSGDQTARYHFRRFLISYGRRNSNTREGANIRAPPCHREAGRVRGHLGEAYCSVPLETCSGRLQSDGLDRNTPPQFRHSGSRPAVGDRRDKDQANPVPIARRRRHINVMIGPSGGPDYDLSTTDFHHHEGSR